VINFDPTIQSAVIGAAVVLVTFMLTTFFNWLFSRSQRKADEEERFFYEAYPKRLAVYEETINFLSGITNREITLNAPPVPAAEIFECIHALENLLVRIAIFGSLASMKPLELLHEKIIVIYKNVQAGIEVCGAGRLRAIIVQALNAFTKLVREEAGANFVDDKVRKLSIKAPGKNQDQKEENLASKHNAAVEK
jgi:hypothetical protein